jgi:hypothetical protein
LLAGAVPCHHWYLDVRFAVETTKETGMLIFLPFIVQFLMLLARNSYFDNWTWPPAVVFVLVCNILLAGVAWGLLRGAAQRLRNTALQQLRSSLLKVRLQIASASSVGAFGKEKLALKEMIKRIGFLDRCTPAWPTGPGPGC